MLRKLLFSVAALGLLLLPTTAKAQEYGFDPGDFTLFLSAAGQNDVDFDGFTASANAELSYFFTDNLAAGVRQSVLFDDLTGSNLSGGTRVLGNWYFDMGQWQPFIGASLGYLYGDAVVDTWIAGPEVGVAWFASESTLVKFTVAYDFLFEDAGDADDTFDDGQFVYSIAIGWRF